MANKRIEKKLASKNVSASNVKQYNKPPKLIHGVDITDTNELSMSNMGRDFTGLMLTPNKLFAIWDNAANGDPSDQVALFNSILDRDGYIASLVATRIKSVKNKKWSVVGTNEAKREQIEKILKGAKDVYASASDEENEGDNLWNAGGNLIGFSFDKMLSYLMLKPFFGYSGVKVDFGAGGEYINTFMPVAPENWRFTTNWGVYIQPTAGTPIYINGNKRYEYVMHMGSSDGRYGIPPCTGLCRPISYMYFRKSYAEMHQSRLLEKFGIPWVVSKLAPTDFNNPDTRLNIEKQLKNLAGDGAAVVTKDSEIKLEGLGAASNSGVFLEAIKEIKESLAIAILGQQASVQQTGGFSNGQIQENVRNDITASDCKEIEDTVTGLINTIEMNTWGTTECSFKIDYEGLADVEKLGKISDLANKSGLEVDSDYMRKAFSVPVNKKKETATSNTIENILGGGNAQGDSMGLPTSETVNPTESATSSATPAEIAPTPEINNESVNQNPEAALAGLGTAALNDTVKKTKLMAFADISKDVVVNDYITSMVNYSNIDDTLKRRLLYNMPMDTAKAIGYLNDRLSNAILSESGNSDEINKLRFAVMAINPDSVYASVSKEIPVNKPIENKPSNESVAMADEKPEAYGGSVPDFTSTPSNTAVDGGRDLAAEMISGTSAEHMPVGQAIPKETVPVEQPIVYVPDNRTIEEKRAEYRKIATRINEVYKRVDKLDELARASISVMEMGVGGNVPSGIQMPERKKVTAEEAERIAYNENQQKLNDAITQLALQHYMKENLDVDIDILVEDFMSGIPSAFQRLPLIKNTSWNIYNQMTKNLKENSSIIDNAKYAVEKNQGNMPSWANQITTSAQYSVLNTALNYWYNKRPKNKESGELLKAIKDTSKQITASLLNTTESAINTFLPKIVSADGWLNLEHTTNAYVANNIDKVMTSKESDRYKKLNSNEKITMLQSISAKLLELKNRDSKTYNEKEKSNISELNKWYDNSERTRVLSRNYALRNNFIKGRNGLEQNYYDVIRTATDMVTAMSIGASLGAISKLKYASGLGNFATFGALSNYDVYSEMYANGKSRDESALIAATVSPIIGLLDKIETTIAFGKGTGVLEKETLRKLMKDVSGIWTKTLLNKAKTIGINITSEVGIETLQGFVQEMARYLASEEAFKNNNDEQIVKDIMDMAVKYGQDIPFDELKSLVDNLRSAYSKDKLNYRGNVNFMEVLSNTFEQGLSAAMVMPAIVILGHKVSGSGRTMKDIEKNTRQTMAQIREDANNKKRELFNTKKELTQQLNTLIPEKNKASIENNIFKIEQEVESLDRINDYAKNLQNKFQSGMSAFEADTLLKNYMNFETKGDAGVAIRNALADTLGIDNKNMTIDELATLTDIAEDVILLDNNSLTEQDGKRMFKVGDQLYDENWAGSYDTGDGKIYLNANTAKTPEALNTFFKGVVRHEMTHKGLAGIKNKTATALFRDVWSNMNDVEKYNIAKDYVQHYQPTSINEDSSVNMDRVNNENNKALQDLLAEEYLGKQSENYSGFIKTPVGKRAYYKIKEIWRMIAPKASFSDNEIAKILVEARKNIPTVIIEQRYKQAVKDEAKLLESIKESPDKIPTDLVDIERIDELGYTNNPEDAGWITPDGKMINLNRSDANMKNRLDHRTITKSGESSIGMMQFMNAGYIRYSPENNAFEIAKKPTPEQLLTIKRILSSTTKNPRVSIDEIKNKIGKDGVYEFTETATDYDNSYNADELISNIEQSYASKNIQDKYVSPLLPFLKPKTSTEDGGGMPETTMKYLESLGYKPENASFTQIANTKKTYKEYAEKMIDKSKPVLDYSSGLGMGKQELINDGFTVTDFEPFAKENREAGKPDYSNIDASDIPNNSQEQILNFYVLNVVPDDVRAQIVKDIYSKLKEGGKAHILARSWNELKDGVNKGTFKIVGEHQVLTSRGTFQKGFTQAELVSYLQTLLPDAVIIPQTKIGHVGAIIQKPIGFGVDNEIKPSIAGDINSANFKNWFGDWKNEPKSASKVVDKDGKPLVVYHGSVKNGFYVFDTNSVTTRSASGDVAGSYFTSSRENAWNYTRPPRHKGKYDNGRVFSVYLDIKNPIYTAELIKKLQKKGMTFSEAKQEAIKTLLTPENDGIIFTGDSWNPSEYVVFKPTQIKSATENIGTYDATNPDIRYSVDSRSVGKQAYSEIMDKIEKENPVIHALISAGIKKVYLPDYKGKVEDIKGTWFTTNPNLGTPINDVAGLLTNYLDMNEGEIINRLDELKDLTYGQYKKSMAEETKQEKSYWENMAEQAGIDIKNPINPDDFFLDENTVNLKNKKQVEDYFDQMFIENLGNKIPISQMKDTDYQAKYKIDMLNDKKINALKDIETAVQPNSDIAIKDSIADKWITMSPEEKTNTVESIYDKAIDEVYSNSTLAFAENDFDKAFTSLIKYMDRNIPSPLYVEKVYRSHDKTTIILEVKSKINPDYNSYIRISGTDESGNGEYINELDSSIKSDFDSVYSNVIDVDKIMDFVNKEAKQELSESKMGDIIEKDANIGMTINTIKKMLGQDVVTDKTLQLLKDIAENKTEKESIINPNANRVRMPAMTLVQFLDGLNTAIKEGESRRDFNYNNNLVAQQNVYDFINEHIMFDRVREKIKKDINKVSLLENTPEQYFSKVNAIVNGYNNIVDISKDVEKNIESAAKYIMELYPNRADYPIILSLTKKLNRILSTSNDNTLRSGKELKEISNLISVAEQYNTVNHAQENKTNITAQSKLVEGYAEGKNDWRRFIGGKVNYLIELLRQNRNNKAIRNKIITTIRSIANITTPEGADKTLTTFDDEINTIINNENVRNSTSNIIKTVKEMKRLGTRANEFYKLFSNIRASMPKALSISSVLNQEAPSIINSTDVLDIKTKLNNRMNELIKSNPEESGELSETFARFNKITVDENGNINLGNLTADELESLNNALVALGTMASTDFKDFKNQLKKEYAAMEHLVLAQVATAAIRKSKTTLPRLAGIGNGIKNAFVRKDIIKNVGKSFLNYLYGDASNNLIKVNNHNAKVNEEIAKLDENSVDDIPKIEALRNELIIETAITQQDLNLLDSIFNDGYSKSLSGSSVDEIGALAKVLNYKADTLLNSDEEFQNKTGQSVKLLSTMFDNIYNTMKSDRVNFMNAINKIIGSKKPSPMIMNTMSKAVDKPFTTWTDSDFEALGTVVARYSINNGIAGQQYIDENPVDIGILNMFSNEVLEKQRNQISRNLLALLNNITGFRKIKDWAGLDSSVIANVISLEEDGKIMKTFYSNFQEGEDEAIKITDTFSDGFYESLPQNIRAKFSAKDVERMSQYLTSNGLIDKYRNIFARLTPKNQENFVNKMREKLSKLATVKQQKVKLLTNQGVKKGADINSAKEDRNESVNAYFTEAEAMHVYAMMYADMFNKPQYQFIKDSNDGIVINRGGGKMFGDANDLQNLTSENLGVPLNTTNANIIVNQMLSPEQKRYVELLVERYNKVISPRFKEEYSKATGKAMPEYGMYLPALRYIREPKNKEAGKSSLGSFDIGGVGLDQDGRLKDKVENANAPLIIKDFFALMAETVQFSANYIAFRKSLQDLDNVVSNPLINIALDSIPGYGKGMRDRLKQFEERITGKTLNHPNEYRWLERMMQNVIATNLFIRPRSILSQLASVPMALRYGNISAGDWGYGDAKAIGKSIVRAVNMSQNGFLPWVKGEEYMLDELKHYSGSVYRRIISGYINGVIDNNPQNYHLINALTGHKDEVNRLLALQFYFDRASMSEIAFNSIKYQMEKNKINYDDALKIAKYKSLYNSHDDRIERIAIEEKYLSEYKKQLSELNQEDVNYTKEKADLGEYIISSQRDIADLKNKQAEFNKLYNEYSTPEMQNKLDKYDIAMQDAATRIKKQFETQSMTSILYSPPINEAGVLRVILPLAYRNSWNRRLISVRNLLNVARNRILRGESEATKEYGNILQKELSNMLISGLYMAIVDMIVQSYWYDDKSEEWKKEFLGKAFAGNANIENNIYKFITQWIYESTQASSSMLPFFNELLESGFLSLVGGDTYNPIKGIFGGKPEKMVRALNLLFTEGRYDKSTKQAIAFLIESLSGIPASRILGIVEGSTVGGEQLIEEYREYKNAWKKYDSDKLIKENSNGLYSYDKDYEKFMLDIKERMIKEGDKEGALEIEDEINAKKIRFDKINKSKKTIPFADANAIRIANNLIDQKNAISKLTNAYEITKRQIEPYIKEEPVIIPNKGSVFFVNGSVSDRLDSDLVLQGLIKIAKVSPDIAKALLKKWSTPRNMSQYVKISNKDYITTGAR